VDLPHDFVVEGEFTPTADQVHGSLPGGVAWYRKTFALPAADAGLRIRLEFDGVQRDCEVWVNGHFIGRHLSGFTSFGFDITEVCHFGGANCVAVRVDATLFELWSYEGGGIYRDVRLVKTHPVHVPQWGTFVRATSGTIQIETTVANASELPVDCEVVSQVDGHEVTGVLRLPAEGHATRQDELTIPAPRLWRLDDPHLYRLVTLVKVAGEVVDRYETTFGIREVRFDAERGFFLNGEPVKLRGVCNHQDHAGVGIAIPARLEEWRVEQMLAMGCNAIRSSHNPSSPALLDICDRLGVLVMAENRLLGASDEMLGQLESLIRRDRNHPCIFQWSLGNEEMVVQETPVGTRLLRRMQNLAHRLDPTRTCTYACNCDWLKVADLQHRDGFVVEVYGANYRAGRDGRCYDEFHAKYPRQPLIGTETGGSVSARGVYLASATPPPPLSEQGQRGITWSNPARKDLVSSYSETFTPWGCSIMDTWRDCATRPFLDDTFLWTGFDYRGETFPYGWPSVVTRYGLMDLCGFPKDAYWYYRSWWRTDETVLHVFPHWNWRGHEGEVLDVWCYSSCAAVELLLNGQSLGRQAMERNGHLMWRVPFAPGKLEARGFDAAGKLVRTTVNETTGAPAKLVLQSDRPAWKADGEDVLVVAVSAVDEAGKHVPDANVPVRFRVIGPATILGVGNGDPESHEPDKSDRRRLYHGWCQVLLQARREAGTVELIAESDGVASAKLTTVLERAASREFVPAFMAETKSVRQSNAVDGAL
jgi:beta-galactosidase